MTCNVVFYSPSGHWTNVFEDLWTNLLNSAHLQTGKPNYSGADVKLCLGDGKILLHRLQLVKFTTMLDFAKDKLQDYVDPWGILTLVMPHFKMETLQALGRLMYCGDSGYMSEGVMQDIKGILRPEYGGKSNNEAGLLSRVINTRSKRSSGLENESVSRNNSDPIMIILDDVSKERTTLKDKKRSLSNPSMSPAKRGKKSSQSESVSNALKANTNKLLNQIVTHHKEKGKDKRISDHERPNPVDLDPEYEEFKGLDTVNLSPESESREKDSENAMGKQIFGSKFKRNSDTDSAEKENLITRASVTPDERQLVSKTARIALGRYAQKADAYGIPLTLNEIIDSSTNKFIDLTSGLRDQQIALCKDIRKRAKNKVAAQNCRQRKLNIINNLADEVGKAKKYKEKLVAEQDQLCQLKTEWSKKLLQLEESILRGINRDPSQWELGISTTSTSGVGVSVMAREQKK